MRPLILFSLTFLLISNLYAQRDSLKFKPRGIEGNEVINRIDVNHVSYISLSKHTGDTLSIITWNDDTKRLDGYSMYYQDNKLSQRVLYVNQKFTSLEQFFEDGNIEEYWHLLNDSIEMRTSYYRNGNIKNIGPFYKGKKTGLHYYFYDNGKLMSMGNYAIIHINDANVFFMIDKYNLWDKIITYDILSVKDGIWFNFDRNDTSLQNKEEYEMGILK